MKSKIALITVLLVGLSFSKVGSSTIISDEQKRVMDKYGYEVKVVDEIQDTNGLGVNPAGVFIKKEKTILLDSEYVDWAFNHEYGHFIDSINYNISTSKKFKDIYLKEKDQFESAITDYARSSNIEYFACCYKMYLEEPTKLEEMCKETYDFLDKLRKE